MLLFISIDMFINFINIFCDYFFIFISYICFTYILFTFTCMTTRIYNERG